MALTLRPAEMDANTLRIIAAGRGPLAVKARQEIARRTHAGLRLARAM